MPTRRLFGTLGVLLLLYLLGANLQSGMVYAVVSCGVGFVVAGWVGNRRAARGVVAARRAPALAVAGVPFEVAYDVTLRALHGAVVDRELGVRLTIAGSGSVSAQARRARGVCRLAGFEVVTGYPFGLFERRVWVGDEREIVVVPSYDEVDLPMAASAQWGSEVASTTARDGSEYAGVREYAPGDSYRTIHWKKSARGSGLFVRELALPARLSTLVLLDNRVAGRASSDEFEAAVSAAATVLAALARNGFETGLAFYENGKIRRLSGSFDDYLVALARVAPEAGECEEFSDILGGEGAGAFASVVLVRSPDPTCEPPAVFFGFRERVAVVIGSVAAVPGARTVRVELVDGERRWTL